MTTKFGKLAATVMAGAVMMTGAAPVSAQDWFSNQHNGNGNASQRDRVIMSYCQRNPRDRDCRGYYGGGWRDRDYDTFYRSRRNSLDGIAAGLFGFGFGALLGGAIANQNNNNYGGQPVYGGSSYQAHVNACYSRYRSYDEETDTFMGYDGIRRRCQL
ncbi:BA14K-like protein [Devosia sp. LC5]|uniref:BA14K family protein n=1 Tax=Devosia sp. LC5 TaxID=1502724 RepID=UPI0004E30C42|nr:BA14K family protein [Devosia sp. LC5]KFC71078.1 BA14K-like protein [Devosia sp. LC5]